MSFKEFVRWCNERACDGCWGLSAAITCVGIMHEVEEKPFWKREKGQSHIEKMLAEMEESHERE